MKKNSKFLVATMVIGVILSGCSSKPVTKVVDTAKPVATQKSSSKPTQADLDAKLKAVAVKADFVKLNGHESENKDLKVKVTGKVSVVDNTKKIELFDCFQLTTKEGDGYGRYTIINVLSTPVAEGDTVTAYGTVNEEKSGYGGTGITSTVVEK
ncbi:MAG TPA: hypothetical protein VIM42_05695 [Clostridium sp.]|uniref:hypothetical protein n=1 Tax=Clostridium algoriphilum TaxID=198347 RepID=UPI001CF3E423|nr:hypothetical protein [Clostridium algoriphilum]MCB2292424.1 hypothetical protein [Clostridium algoriphilum]